jgi:hypothetical protein
MQTDQIWLVLVIGLPREPSSLRVRAWRRLRALGALALKQGVYLLPASAETTEQFQWLAQEVQRDGGEATLLRVDRVENLSDSEIIRRFRAARDADYRELAERYRGALRRLERGRHRAAGPRVQEEASRLARDLARIRDVDHFEAPGAAEALRAKEALEARLRPATRTLAASRRLPDGRGRLWVTRPRPHVDRLASAWFIRRFIDAEARIVFAEPDARPRDAIPFDMVGAELGHDADRCTFETLLALSGRREPALTALAEIVHEADLRDGKFARAEARGVDLAVRGLLAAIPDDEGALAAGLTLFEGLYGTLAGSV